MEDIRAKLTNDDNTLNELFERMKTAELPFCDDENERVKEETRTFNISLR